MPTIVANGLEIGYEAIGAGPPLVILHGAARPGRATVRAPARRRSPSAFRVYLPDARGHGGDALGRRRRLLAADWLVDDLAGVRRRARARDVPPARLLDGRDDRARRRGRGRPTACGRSSSSGSRPQREPRASVARRLMDPDRIERDDPAWAAALAARHDPVAGRRRLAAAPAGDRRTTSPTQPLLTPRELRAIDAPTLVVVRRPRSVRAGRPRLGARPPGCRDARLLVAPDCGHDVMTRQPGLAQRRRSPASIVRPSRSTAPRADDRRRMPR